MKSVFISHTQIRLDTAIKSDRRKHDAGDGIDARPPAEKPWHEPVPGFLPSALKGIMLAGAVYPSVVAMILMVGTGGLKNPAAALLGVFITGGIGSFFGFLISGVFGSLCLMLMISIARGFGLSGDRTWVAVFAGGLTGLIETGIVFLHLFEPMVSANEQLFVYLVVGIATLMGQVGAWLGVRRAIIAASQWRCIPRGIELPRFQLRILFWMTTSIALGLGVVTFFRLPIFIFLEIAGCWLLFQTCSMACLLGLDRWMSRPREVVRERST